MKNKMKSKMKSKNKIWVYYPPADGLVKIKLKEGKEYVLRWGGGHEEGWFYHGESYVLKDGWVYSQSIDDGIDCDGRLTRYFSGRAPVEDFYYTEGSREVRWEDIDQSQVDLFAEMMGY